MTGVLLGTGYVVASWIGVGFSYLSTAGNTGMTVSSFSLSFQLEIFSLTHHY